MEKWDGVFVTFNPKPTNRKKCFFLWPNSEFNIVIIHISSFYVVVEKAMTFG